MPYLLAGPFVALVGIVAVFFVLRRKSVEKRSMYSARRSQIEHKVRAARQRTLTPRGRSPRPEPTAVDAASPFAQTQAQPTMAYQAPAYEAPPAASPFQQPDQAPSPAPWDMPAAPVDPSYAQPQPSYTPPAPAYTPPEPEPFRPAPEPTPMAPSEPAWTPAPAPSETAEKLETVAPAASATSAAAAGGWSVVSTDKPGPDAVSDDGKKKRKKDKSAGDSSWQLASGDAPGLEAEETEVGRPAGTAMAVAQYAVLVVGLVMVLIGVLVMVANSHVT